MSDAFDFDAFMRNIDPKLAKEMQMESLTGEVEKVMSQVAPRLWIVLLREMQRDKTSNLHQNAVLNSAIFAVLAWAAMITPESEDNDDMLMNLVTDNMRAAMKSSRDPKQIQNMVAIAMQHGQRLVLEDANVTLSQTVSANTNVLQELIKLMKEQK